MAQFQTTTAYYAKATKTDDIETIKQIYDYSKQDYTKSGFDDIFTLIVDNRAIKSLKFYLAQKGEVDLGYLKDQIQANPNDKILKEMLKSVEGK